MYHRHGQHSDGDGRTGHVDGGAQRDGDRVGIFSGRRSFSHSVMLTGMLAAELRVKKPSRRSL
ncbi:hypothetical protein ACLK12_16435 [Escherichia coli]